MSRAESPKGQGKSARPTSSSSSSSSTSNVPGFSSLPNRAGGVIASRRARQIQVDEGIVPAPYRPPAMRQGASNAETQGSSFHSSGSNNITDASRINSGIPDDNDTNSMGSRLFRGRARAGTLPSSWGNLSDQSGLTLSPTRIDEPAGVIGSASNTKAGRPWSHTISQYGPPFTASEGLELDSVVPLRSSPANSSSAFSNYGPTSSPNLNLGSSRIPSSRPFRSNSVLEYDKVNLYPPLGSDSSASSTFSPPSSFDTTGTPASLQTNRNRSGSLASTLAGLGNNAFGPSIFTSTWSDQSGQGRLTSAMSSRPLSRRSSTLLSPSSEEQISRSRLALEFGNDGQIIQDEHSLDRNQEVHTLDYLGLEQDEAGSHRSNVTPLRNRASTMASVPPRSGNNNNTSNSNSAQTSHYQSMDKFGSFDSGLLLNESTADDIYTQYALQHGLDASQLATLASAVGLPTPSTSSPSQTGRVRAGTVAALGGPGGRQRIEQELRRMAAMGNIPGSNGQGLNSILNGMRGVSIGSESRYSKAPLEGFPYLEINTPPTMTPNRSSPFQTSPSTPLTTQDQILWNSNASTTATPTSADVGMRSTNQSPSRSLWIGNLDSNTTGQELMRVFAPYGAIESLRLLPEKECGFVNFVEMSDAIRAREDVLGRLEAKLEHFGTGIGGTVRIGYGKIDSVPSHTFKSSSGQSSNVGGNGTAGPPPQNVDSTTLGSNLDFGLSNTPMTPGVSDGTSPTRALWVGSIPSSVTPATLLSIFQPFGPVESARILTHKNCGFVNFERVDDAVRARKMLNGRDVLGSDVGAMRIGFAKVPTRNVEALSTNEADSAQFEAAIESLASLKGSKAVPKTAEQQVLSGELENYRSNLVVNLLNQRESESADNSRGGGAGGNGGIEGSNLSHANKPSASSSSSIVPASDKGGVPLPAHMAPRPSLSDLQLLMSQLSAGQANRDADVASVAAYRPSATYYMTIPLVSEVSSGRRFETSKLREMRRNIEGGQLGMQECNQLAWEYLGSIVDLASDYIGNTLVQKFFEHCSDQVKMEMLHRLAPHLAMTGCHKNGTWAAQKILDCCKSSEQVTLIAQHLRPYIPGLLLDQFGNYVVQCCLPWQQPLNDFVFDAMVDRCWEIAQGRFGARSMRACLEKDSVTDQQRKRVAMAVILNSVPLATSPNGSILLTWLLDTSGLSKSYKLLAPRFSPHLTHLCTHKLASTPVLRLINQKFEPEASRTILDALFESENDQVLEEVVIDQVHGSQFVTKVLASPTLTKDQRDLYCAQVRTLVERHRLVGVPAYRRLCEDLGLLIPSFTSISGSDRNMMSGMSQGTVPYQDMAAFALPMSDVSPMPGIAHYQTMSVPPGSVPQDAFNPYWDSTTGLYRYQSPSNS